MAELKNIGLNNTIFEVPEYTAGENVNISANHVISMDTTGLAEQFKALYGTPLTAATAAGMTDKTRVYVYTGNETGYNNGHWYYWNGTAWTDGGAYNSEGVTTDTTLTLEGIPADAKATGDWVRNLANTNTALLHAIADESQARQDADADLRDDLDDLAEVVASVSGLSEDTITALLACFQNVMWDGDDGEELYQALEDALYADRRRLVSLNAVYDSSGHTVYPYDTLESLKQYITVTASFSDGTTETVTDYTLSGSLATATSNITVEYQSKTTQISVSVTIDSALLYYLPRGYVLGGTDATAIDTDIVLQDTNKAYTILFDFTDELILTSSRSLVLIYSITNASDTRAGSVVGQMTTTSNNVYYKKYYILPNPSSTQETGTYSNAVHRIKGAITHASGTSTCNITLYVDGNAVISNRSVTLTSWTASNVPVSIGKRGTGGYNVKGTLNLCCLYNRQLSFNEVKQLLDIA